VISAALRELMAAGVTGDALVTAVERIETALEPRRTPGALRQQRYRERHKASQIVTSDEAHSIEVNSISEIQKKKRKISTAICVTWSPSDADTTFARSKGWDDLKIQSEASRFRDHAIANNRRQADWAAAWRNWVTSPYQKKGHINGAGNSTMAAFDRIELDLGAGEQPVTENPPMRDVTPRGE
jgi:hypothetical protein